MHRKTRLRRNGICSSLQITRSNLVAFLYAQIFVPVHVTIRTCYGHNNWIEIWRSSLWMFGQFGFVSDQPHQKPNMFQLRMIYIHLVDVGIIEVQRDWNMQYIKYYLFHVQLIWLKSIYYVYHSCIVKSQRNLFSVSGLVIWSDC